MRPSHVIARGVGDLATSAVGAVAGAATTAAGAVSGAVAGGGLGALSGAVRGVTGGVGQGRRSTPAAMITLAVVGITGIVEWPVLIVAGGAAIVLDKVINQDPMAGPHAPADAPHVDDAALTRATAFRPGRSRAKATTARSKRPSTS